MKHSDKFIKSYNKFTLINIIQNVQGPQVNSRNEQAAATLQHQNITNI